MKTAAGKPTAHIDKAQLVEHPSGNLMLYVNAVNGRQVYNKRVRIKHDGSVSLASMKTLKSLLK